MKVDETDDARTALHALLEKSSGLAHGALADSVAWPPRRMSAAELFDFWRGIRLVSMSTVGRAGQPHTAPVHAELHGDHLRLAVYEDARRRHDIASNPRVAFTAWNDDGAVVILYGRASEIEGSLRSARPSQSGRERRVVDLEVKLTRIYAMSAGKVCAQNR
jgi:hypothetical protein